MLNRLKSLLAPRNKTANSSKPNKQIIPHSKHGISEKRISRAALKTMRGLQDAGYEAYLVGGGVRDLLLDGQPKDFDVATDATPEQVRKVFRNARIIGRRFQIVHVRFGREIIEVTTFRGNHEDTVNRDNSQQQKGHTKARALSSDKGILLRDNVYGDLESDAIRRDFTINALYYDCSTQEIIDFTGGISDLNNRRLSIIGDPKARYREDPVRMLRAVRFASKLGFQMEQATEANIHVHSDYLAEIPAARLFEEVLKLFMSGSAVSCLHMLQEFSLLEHLFPGLSICLKKDKPFDLKFVDSATGNTDKRVRQGKSVTPAFIYASFLWPPLQAAMRQILHDKKTSLNEAFYQSAQGVVSQQLSVTSIPKRFLIPMREIWQLQYRLDKRTGKRAEATLENPRFRAAYDFLLLREQAGEDTGGLGNWWTRYQHASVEDREQMVKDLGPDKKPRRRRKRKPAKKPGTEQTDIKPTSSDGSSNGNNDVH